MINIKPTDKLVFELEMYQVDYNEQKKESLRVEISEKYGVPLKNVEVNFKPITKDIDGNKLSLASDVINDIQNPKFQLELFKEYIDLKEINDVDFSDIEAIDSQVNAFVDFDSYSKYKNYKFKYVKWDNYLSYGKGNYFDFTKLNGLVLLNGIPENQCGKTTFAIDLIRFALFGKAQKSPTLDSVFNTYLPEETEVMVEAGLEIDGMDYVIRRTVTRPALKKRTAKSKAKQTVEYFRLINGSYELIENCEEENNTQTNNVIKETVGNVDDFNLVISATSYTLGDLLRMGQSDKGKLFSRWLGLLSIEKKEEVAKEMWKKQISPKLFSSTYNKATLVNEVSDYQTCVDDNNNKIVETTKKNEEILSRIEELNKKKYDILSKKKEIKEELVKTDVTTVERNIKHNEEQLEIERLKFSKMKDEYMLIKDVSFDEEAYNKAQSEIKEKQRSINELNISNGSLKTKISYLRNDTKRIEQLSEQGICPHCKQKIDKGVQGDFIEANVKEENALIEEGKNNRISIEKLEGEIKVLEENCTKLLEDKEKVYQKQKKEIELRALKVVIENLKLTLENLNKTRQDIESNKENIRINNEIDIKLNNVDAEIKVENNLNIQCVRQIQNCQSENKHFLEEIDKRRKMIEKLTEEEKIIRNWNIYQQLVGKNGIVKIILKRALPVINNEIARILNGLCDFDVVLSISDDNKVCIDLIRDGEKMDLGTCASGFEGTFSALALRSALASISTISKSNLLILDEIDSTIAISNYDKLTELYKRILSNYQFIIHIAHNELLEHIHDMTISVYKENNVSKIKLS